MLPEGNKGGQEVQDDRRIDEVDPFPPGVEDPIGARGRGWGEFRKGMCDLIFG